MPTPLDRSHFSAGLGACIRLFYPRGGLLVAMFERTPDGLVQIADAWSRAVEDVEGVDGVWIRAIEEYLELQRIAPERRREALERRRDELRARTGDMAAQAIAFDLDRHLALAGTGAVPQRPLHWLLLDIPREAVAAAGRDQRLALIQCAEGQGSIVVEALGFSAAGPLTLSVDGTRFALTGARLGERDGRPTLIGEIRSHPDLLAALEGASRLVAVAAGDETIASMPPSDVLQKLAFRCRALLNGGVAEADARPAPARR